ncbi:MAG: MFS transporter, partial [Armatimonadota bacterium]
IPFFDIIGKSLPSNYLGRFFGTRRFFGGTLAFAAGFAVKHILDERTGYPFPASYSAVFLLAWAATALSVLFFSLVDEPPGMAHRRRVGLGFQMRRGPRIMRRNRNYRNLVRVRVLSGLTNFALPFYFPFAQLRLGASEAMVGLFVSILMLSGTVSNVLWSYVGDAQGNRRLLLLTNSVGLGAPVLALLAARLSPEVVATWLGVSFTPQLVVLSLAVLLVGFAQTGRMMGETNFLLEIAPARQRPTYMGIMHAILLPLAFSPLVGAAVIGARQRFELGFALSLLFGIGCLVATLWLKEPRAQAEGAN